MKQPATLFPSMYSEPLAEPRARATDPATSHAAAEAMMAGAKHHREIVLDLVFMRPGSTTHELAKLSAEIHGADKLNNQQINRRLSELADEGRAKSPEDMSRVCRCGRKKCARYTMQTWFPID